jgi:hypothetical protein
MSDDIYEIIEQQGRGVQGDRGADAPAEGGSKPYDKEEYAAWKKTEREQLFEMADAATQRISADPVALRDYLDVMARFPSQLVINTLLIFEQMPEASCLRDFDAWKKRKVSVKKDTSALSLFELGDEYTKKDGTIGVYYDVRKVFDERQTTARHLEPRHPEMRALLAALINSAPVHIKTSEALAEGQFALYDHESKTISVATGIGEQQLFRALVTEMAHARIAEKDGFYDRGANHDTALVAAYVVAGRFGADNSGVMPMLSPRVREGSVKDVRGELSRIRDASKTILDRADRTLDAARPKEAVPRQTDATRGGRDGR